LSFSSSSSYLQGLDWCSSSPHHTLFFRVLSAFPFFSRL
jgi:hypothetical protein